MHINTLKEIIHQVNPGLWERMETGKEPEYNLTLSKKSLDYLQETMLEEINNLGMLIVADLTEPDKKFFSHLVYPMIGKINLFEGKFFKLERIK